MSQSPPSNLPSFGLPRTPEINSLITYAAASTTRDGLRDYTVNLIKLFVSDQMGSRYIDAVSRRLATAELQSKDGSRRWISEDNIAQAFNALMGSVATPPGPPIHTDKSMIHLMRIAIYNTSADLSSVTSHESECLPTEAVLVMVLLIANNGTLSQPNALHPPTTPPGSAYVAFSVVHQDARALIFRYVTSHSHSKNVKLYDDVTRILGF